MDEWEAVGQSEMHPSGDMWKFFPDNLNISQTFSKQKNNTKPVYYPL